MDKQHYKVGCYTCQHNGQGTCPGCNTFLNGENEPYENWRLREDLEAKDRQIAELEEQNKVKDLALIDLSNALVEGNLPYEEIEEFKGEAGIESVGVDCEDVFYYFIWKAENELQEEAEELKQ